MTLWPYVAHTPVTAATLDPDTAASVGDLFASIGEVPATERRAPFDRIPARLARLRPGTPERDLVNGIVAELEQRLAPLLTGKLAAAHGDPSVDNLLITDTGPTLIDLDSFAAMPDGWDLACLRLHLQRKHGNSAAWQALMGRYRETRAVPDGAVLDVLEQAKAVMGATFAATFELDDGQKQRLRTQLVELHRWVTGGQEPQRLTLIG